MIILDVGQRVNQLRLEKKMTAKQLATLVGVTPAFISALEHKSTNVSLRTLSKICETLEVTLAEFFSEEKRTISPSLISQIEQLTFDQQTQLELFLKSLSSTL